MRPRSFTSPEAVETIVRYGPHPVAQFEQAAVDAQYNSRLDGQAGHIPIGDPQTLKSTANLPAQQRFVGAMQLTNLLNAKRGGPNTAIPATKPNPGVVPLTQMQQQLALMSP